MVEYHYFVVKPRRFGCLAGESNAGHVMPVELSAHTHGPLRGIGQLLAVGWPLWSPSGSRDPSLEILSWLLIARCSRRQRLPPC
jgi:hypothetical protein